MSTDIGTGTDTSCQQVMACVCSNLGDGLACTGTTLEAELSTDADNVIAFGSDGGLFVASSSAQAGVTGGDGIAITGDQGSGFTIAADLSTDADNALVFGTDNGLYVPAQPSCQALLTASLSLTTAWQDIPLTLRGTPDGFTQNGTKIAVTEAGEYLVTATMRFGIQGSGVFYGGMNFGTWGAQWAGSTASYAIPMSTVTDLQAGANLGLYAQIGPGMTGSVAMVTFGAVRLGPVSSAGVQRDLAPAIGSTSL